MEQQSSADKMVSGPPIGGRTSPAHDERSTAGWLCQAPCSWFQLLLRTLPRQSKLALFQTSRKLCRQVVHSTHSITLRLRCCKRQSYNTAAVRQQVITGLLERCVNLKIMLDRDSEQPFPAALSSNVTELTLEQSAWHNAKQQAALAWSAMQQLHTLVFWGNASAQDVRAFCAVLNAGKLPRLRSLTWWPRSSKYNLHMEHRRNREAAVAALLQRLACAAGKQVKHLAATDELLTHVLQFTSLESVTVQSGISVSEETAQRLCQHPTLRHVTISGQADDTRRWSTRCGPSITGDHSHLECKWETLTLMSASPQLLAVLPLAGLKALRFEHQLAYLQEEDKLALDSAVARKGAKIVCVSHDVHEKGVFTLGKLCKQSLLLVPYLRDVHTLHMTLEEPQDQLLLRDVYARLPSCVTCIVIQRGVSLRNLLTRMVRDSLKFHEASLLYQLPKAIAHVKLEGFHFHDFMEQSKTLTGLVLQAPAHVRNLTFVKLPGAAGFLYDYIGAVVPAHLRLQFTPWS